MTCKPKKIHYKVKFGKSDRYLCSPRIFVSCVSNLTKDENKVNCDNCLRKLNTGRNREKRSYPLSEEEKSILREKLGWEN